MESILFNPQTVNPNLLKHRKPPTLKKIPSFSLKCSSLKPKPKPIHRVSIPEVANPVGRSPILADIEGLIGIRKFKEALELFEILQSKDSGNATASTYDSLITACIETRSVRDAKFVFRQMIDVRFEFDQYFRNRVLVMHLKCGLIAHARRLFDEMPERDVGSWNAILSGFLDLGKFDEAFDLFLIMWSECYDAVGSRTLMNGIRAAGGLNYTCVGKQLHSIGVKSGLYDNCFVSCALIKMYSTCDRLEEAQWVFDEMLEKTVVAWNTIIASYALHGYSEEALDLYYEMQSSGVKMDHFTFSTVITICTRLGSLEHAKQIHTSVVRNGFENDLVANSALIDLYCKWGRIEDARNVFNRMSKRNLISWNALIQGYGVHGLGAEAVSMFDKLVAEGFVPNHVTFLAVLNACSKSKLSSKGREIFESMSNNPKTKPRAMHYACMVELFGREGLLKEAHNLIESAPFPPTKNMWAALLIACRVHGDLELGKYAAEKLVGLEPEKLGNYIVLLNIYNGSGRTAEAVKILEVLKRRGLTLVPACSWIEIKKQPYKFVFGDKSHPKSVEIYKKLDEVMEEIGKLGYRHGGKCLLPDVEKEELKSSCCHSEKLAIAFGLISTLSSSLLQVMQRHRVCEDCHRVIKMMAKVTKREIVLRDAHRFHHFSNGVCSCGDYW